MSRRLRSKRFQEIRKRLILDEDDRYLMKSPGNVRPVPQGNLNPQYRFWLEKEEEYVHRFIMKAKPGEYVDHINGNPCDNRKENLRITTNMQNCWNTSAHRDSKYSKYKGVTYWNNRAGRRKRWVTQIKAGAIRKKAYFLTELEAALQYDIWAIEMHGEFAVLNFVQEDAA